MSNKQQHGTRPDTPDTPQRDEARSDRRGGEDRVFSQRDWDEANRPTDPERRRRFRDMWAASHLPDLPKREGFHRCWVSTNHANDTVPRRLALGYTLLKLEDLVKEGWAPEQHSVKDGSSTDGLVRWREMVAMETTAENFADYMREFHRDQPRDMVRDIYAPLEETADRVRESGGRVEFGEGFREMIRQRPRADREFEI